MARRLLAGGLAEVVELTDSIRTWVADWNGNPRPFVWHKNADQILDSLANYCRRISDSGH